jgi:hypothetical protein
MIQLATNSRWSLPAEPGRAPMPWLRRRWWIVTALAAATAVSSLLVLNFYALPIFPRHSRVVAAREFTPIPGEKFAYAFPYHGSEPDLYLNWRNQAELFQDRIKLSNHVMSLDIVGLTGGGAWTHPPGRIVFSTLDNSDPRTNGHAYTVTEPWFYEHRYGRIGLVGLLLSGWGLRRLNRRPFLAGDPGADHGRSWRRQLAAAAFLFLAGLYCNTGTLAPYAITTWPHQVQSTGYYYNPDHPHFRVLYEFVNGAPRAVWNKAIFLRRILFPVLAWPLMRTLGFEVGGAIASLLLSTAAMVGFCCWLRRRVGIRGALAGTWLLALSPGAAYWGGMPYPYALIFPGCLALFACLHELAEQPGGRRKVAALSLGMGLIYTGYDLAAYFVPATVLALALRRRFRVLALSLPVQLAPLGLWLAAIKFALGQNLATSNGAIYEYIFGAFLRGWGLVHWGGLAGQLVDVTGYVFFGANFFFLPALFLVLVAINPLTARLKMTSAEAALLLAAAGIILLNNLSPPYTGWDMHGSWISRIYQPMFPALVSYAARWVQQLPAGCRWRLLAGGIFALTGLGNALIVFGPIAGNPLHLSECAFYRFYDHSEVHWVYDHFLRGPRRPLGFHVPRS